MVNQLPQGWKEVKLKDICVLINGRAFKQHELLDSGKYKVLRVGNFFSNNKWYYSDLELDNDKYCNQGDLLFAWSASFGPKIWNDKKTIYHYHIWKVKVNEFVEKKFLYYLLLADSQKIKKSGHGVAMIHITKMDMENRLYTIPTDKDEQEYIVKTLDAVAEMIKLRKETIQLTKDLIPAIFQEMFGNFRGNEPIKKHVIVNPPKALLNDNEEVSFLSMADVSVDGYILSSQRRRYSDVRDGFSSFMNDDVILAKITPCYENGKGAIVRDLINGIGFGSTEFYVLRCDKQYILPEYLFYLLRSDDFMALGKCHMKGAAGQKRLDKLFLQNFGITYPSLSQQEKFAKKVEQINQNLEVQQKDLERLQELFDQLLQKAFTGELTRGEAYGII